MPFHSSSLLAVLLGASLAFSFSTGAVLAAEIEQGFVFIEGVFLPGPYVVEGVPGSVTINGHSIVLAAPPNVSRGAAPLQTNRRGWERAEFVTEGEPQGETRPRPTEGRLPPGDWRPPVRDGRSPFGERRPQDRGNFGPERRDRFPFPSERVDSRRVAMCLEGDGVVISFTGRAVVLLDRSAALGIFRVLAGREDVSTALSLLPKDRPEAEREQWSNWLESYLVTEPLLSRVNLIVENHEQVVAENLADVAATRRLSALAYPLTLCGMVLGVYALGHLLSSPPKGAPRTPSSPRNLKFCRAAIISLALVVLLSALDLAWTLLASQAGQMRELNPLGSSMIEDPLLLTAFKASATFGSCGLLLVLRRHQTAQWAAWWMCLVLTVLTFRWLVLNSMFVV